MEQGIWDRSLYVVGWIVFLRWEFVFAFVRLRFIEACREIKGGKPIIIVCVVKEGVEVEVLQHVWPFNSKVKSKAVLNQMLANGRQYMTRKTIWTYLAMLWTVRKRCSTCTWSSPVLVCLASDFLMRSLDATIVWQGLLRLGWAGQHFQRRLKFLFLTSQQ